MENKNIKAVIFDLDGTLIDTEKYYRIFWPKALAEFGYKLTDEMALSLRSLGRPFAPKQFKEWFGEDFDYIKVRDRRKEMMEEFFDKEGINKRPGADELLQYLKENGYVIAIATASDLIRTEKYLKLVGLYDYFDKFISATMVKEGKPSPDIYEYACKELGILPQNCIAVEDSPNGAKSAFRAGLNVIYVPDQTALDDSLSPFVHGCVDSLDKLIELL